MSYKHFGIERSVPDSPGMEIRIDDLSGGDIAAFLADHISDMVSASPPESRHVLDLNSLRKPEITFWTLREAGEVVACGALKSLSRDHAEIKSMRTSQHHRRRGLASLLLSHILAEAKARGYRRVSIETGSMAFFKPAHALYARHGFAVCPPFDGYREDPNSIFMTLRLSGG